VLNNTAQAEMMPEVILCRIPHVWLWMWAARVCPLLTLMTSFLRSLSQSARPEAFPHPHRSQAENTKIGPNCTYSQVSPYSQRKQLLNSDDSFELILKGWDCESNSVWEENCEMVAGCFGPFGTQRSFIG